MAATNPRTNSRIGYEFRSRVIRREHRDPAMPETGQMLNGQPRRSRMIGQHRDQAVNGDRLRHIDHRGAALPQGVQQRIVWFAGQYKNG